MCFGWGPHLWWSLFLCVGFLSVCAGGALSSSSPPAGGGVGFWCGCCAFGPGAPAVFRWVSCSGCPSRVRHPFRLQFAGLLLRWCLVVRLEGYLLRHLVFYHVPCSSSGACSLRSFPSCRLPWGFQVTGCLSFCFPGDVGWASALPFFFCASPAPTGLQGLAGLKVRSPCWPSLTLGWVCFWPTVSQALVGCEGSLGCPSWFVLLFMCLFVLHLFWGWGGLVTGLWPLLRLLGFGLFWCSVTPSLRLSLLPHPLLLSPWVLPWAFVWTWVCRPRPCLGFYFLLVALPFPCPGFRLVALAVWWSRRLLFSWILPWVLPSRFQCLLMGWGLSLVVLPP